MVHGYRFHFRNEPSLQMEFDSFPANPHTYPQKNNVEVIENSKFTKSNVFSTSSKWYPMSGREARYYSAVPFKEALSHFSWALEIKDVVTLYWDTESKKISYEKGKNYTPKQLQFWIFHTFFPIVLELENIYHFMHVGSVEVDGNPIVFSAPSFGGKSTLTDYFIQKGHRMLSDDSLGIDKRGKEYYAVSSYPFHRPYREPEALGYRVDNFATEAKPLHAVYLLNKSNPDVDVKIIEVKGIEKFKAFHYSSFIDFSFMKKKRFAFFTEMAKHVPLYNVSIPWDLNRLDEVYNAIVKHATSEK